MKQKRHWYHPRVFVAALGLLLLSNAASAAENVLILNSYHRGKVLSDDTIDAIVEDLRAEHPGLTVHIEDMDTKRHSLEDLRSTLLAFYSEKYRDIELSAVVTVDNNALDFALANRQELFPMVPLVFCGLNGFQPSTLDGVEGVTGVVEAIDLDATVRVALALHPDTTHLAVVSDSTPSGREVLEEFRRYSKELPESVQIVELAELTAPELSIRLLNLPAKSVVIRLSFFRDAAGRSFSVDEQADLITSSGLPVYDFWDEAIGTGYVGGYVVTGASQGKIVAGMLNRILVGEAPGQIDVVDRIPETPIFDKRQLLRTGAEMSQLPPNAVLRNDEISIWVRYPRLLRALAIVALLLLGGVLFFAVLSAQRKRHALALSREEQKLRATLRSIGEGVVTTNTQGEIQQMNSMAEKWLALPTERARGRPVREVFQLADYSTDAVIESISRGKSLPAASGHLTTPDGTRLPIVLTATPISLPQGGTSGIVIVFRDMSRENQFQKELAEVRRLDALGQLAGGVAHDFNNVLAAIIGAAELLKQQLDDDSLNELPQLIVDSADQAAELTAQLLSFARKQPFASRAVHMHQIIADSVAVLKRTIDPRIEIEIRPGTGTDSVLGDRALLQSCLLNLGINASHAMPAGGVLIFTTREVSLDSEDCERSSFDLCPGRYIEVRVEDSGTGIAPDVIDRIFEPFFTTKDHGKGTGLGLAAVFGTLQQHSGSVTVHSEIEQGACFTIRLPLTTLAASTPTPLEDGAMEGEGVILVVDDMDPLRKVAKELLEALGYEVLTAANGLEAVEVYEREAGRVEVVLLDMVMPKMSGRDCLIELQRLDPNVRVVAASGFFQQEELAEMTQLGLTDYIIKPYRRVELSKAVSKARAG